MFQGLRNGSAARGRAAVTWRGGRAAVVRATNHDRERPHLSASLRDLGVDEHGEANLGSLQLDGAPLSTVLPEGSYRLLLEDLPNAPRNEMRHAIGWRIRDRIETTLDDAVIELLEMPAHARGGSKPTAYAIVARRDDVQSRVRTLRAAGLNLDTIDLPELCMRNIAVRMPQNVDGVAFLHFTDDTGLLTITRQGVLYLIRGIEIGQLQLAQTPHTQVQAGLIPSICLELQRSLDYYETHFDLPPVTELVLGPGTGMASLKTALTEQLGLRVSSLNLATLFDMDEVLDEESQKECLFAAGAALRTDATSGWE